MVLDHTTHLVDCRPRSCWPGMVWKVLGRQLSLEEHMARQACREAFPLSQLQQDTWSQRPRHKPGRENLELLLQEAQVHMRTHHPCSSSGSSPRHRCAFTSTGGKRCTSSAGDQGPEDNPAVLPKRSEVVFPSLFTPKTGLLGMGLTSGSESPRKTWSRRWIKPQAEAPEAPPAFAWVSSHADHAFLGSHCIQKPAIIISMIALIIPKTLA